MNPVRVVDGTAAPLGRADVDTDQIIGAEWLKRTDRSGFGAGLFASWRSDGNFVLNQPQHRAAVILIAGANFGCGSSREHAVWALRDYGFRAVIASSYGEIFRRNSLRNGLIPAQLDPANVARLLDTVSHQPAVVLYINVAAREIRLDGSSDVLHFALSDHERDRLLNGVDDVDATMARAGQIQAYEDQRPRWLPSVEVLSTSQAAR